MKLQIVNLIEHNKINDAIKALQLFDIEDKFKNDLILIRSKFEKLKSNEWQQIEDSQEITRGTIKINKSLLEILDMVDAYRKILPLKNLHLKDKIKELSKSFSKEIVSRSPIIISIQYNEDPIAESLLLKTEKHLQINLTKDQIEQLEVLGQGVNQKSTMEEIKDIGEEIWEELKYIQPRLEKLLRSVQASKLPQPVAWTGKLALLLKLSKPISLIKIGVSDQYKDFLLLGYGGHYFHPLSEEDNKRTFQERGDQKEIRVNEIILPTGKKADLDHYIIEAAKSEVVISKGVQEIQFLKNITKIGERGWTKKIRAIFSFDGFSPTALDIKKLLEKMPCVSFGSPELIEDIKIFDLKKYIRQSVSQVALPDILSNIRSCIAQHAYETNNSQLFFHSLEWNVWSWIGRPLFANDFGNSVKAAYPHLMDLRSVASKDWYFDRVINIESVYQADNLTRTDISPKEKFHFYLTGAGGTGKSCFLRYVFENIYNREEVLAVWYRVDKPSSDWKNVETRLKEEIEKELIRKSNKTISTYFEDKDFNLDVYLRNLHKNLQEADSPIKEIVIFIDQLERTFESGDNPEFHLLEEISKKIINLLNKVGVGKGIRIFIASRKQYLPDFLGSYLKASKNGLHFNVLQKISNEQERISFVERILKWCKSKELIEHSVSFDHEASKLLSSKVEGHPLNMMLTLIQIFSLGKRGTITEKELEGTSPWEKKFQLDEQLFAKEDLEWFFLLAMAHARTEIVRFEEVWWKIRMVNQRLTTQANQLGPNGILERLWLLGHLGRTIHPRPSNTNRAGFLEFFHANLRDHLISNVMNNSGSLISGTKRRGNTPVVWRALDRLMNTAQDWEQTIQPLPPEDIKALMEHRNVVVEKLSDEDGKKKNPFHLLFLRAGKDLRANLCEAAKECFVYSAVAHDEYSRWAFEIIYPSLSDRIIRAEKWLPRCSFEGRIRIFQYFVELDTQESNFFLSSIVLGKNVLSDTNAWEEIAGVLSEPLYTNRYRDQFIMSLFRADYKDSMQSIYNSTQNVEQFCVFVCKNKKEELAHLISAVSRNFRALQDPKLDSIINFLENDELLINWLKNAEELGINPQSNSREFNNKVPPKIELIVGNNLKKMLSKAALDKWKEIITNKLGVVIPSIVISEGEIAGKSSETIKANQIELKIHGDRIATGVFYPNKIQTLKRHWHFEGLPIPKQALENENIGLWESVVWIDENKFNDLGWSKKHWSSEEAIGNWLESLLRRYIAKLFDTFEISIGFLGEKNIAIFLKEVSGNFPYLGTIITWLVRESVPFQNRKEVFINKLRELISENYIKNRNPELIIRKAREYLKIPLTANLKNERTNQLPLMIFDEATENFIKSNLKSLTAYNKIEDAIIRNYEKLIREKDIAPALVCEPSIRLAVKASLHLAAPRIPVLSFTEIDPEEAVTLEAEINFNANG